MHIKYLLEQTLSEAPIGDIQHLGNWEKSGSFRAPDRKLLTTPRMIERIRNAFSKTQYDFELFFINSPGVGKHMEVGRVGAVDSDPWSWLEKNLPKQVNELKQMTAKGVGFKRDSINVIFTNNTAAEKFLMTPWIIAHRIGHTLRRNPRNARSPNSIIDMYYQEMFDEFIRMSKDILEHYYGVKGLPEREKGMDADPRSQTIYTKFWESIGAFRSARENNLRMPFEMINEMMAQYLVQGEVKFRTASPRIVLGVAWGRPSNQIGVSSDMIADLNGEIESMARTMDYYCGALIGANVGNIYVM